jgi:DMSO/TMAO reductase YedYZ molybdopterin-dependent catalytic subunit
MSRDLDRRRLLAGGLLGAAGVGLAGCDAIANSEGVNAGLNRAEGLTQSVQRLIQGRGALAREYPESAISRDFRANGTVNPDSEIYQAHRAAGFADWRLEIGGLVERPMSLSLADLRRAPARTQITRHDCVEGWSSIGKWTGARLGPLLAQARLKRQARYIAFFCADTLELTLDGTGDYYETIDLVDAFHPQTILAYDKNDGPLPVAHGAPLRLRVERQLGYKMAKYVMRIEAVESFAHLGRGKGGYWEDRGYQWYAGI